MKIKTIQKRTSIDAPPLHSPAKHQYPPSLNKRQIPLHLMDPKTQFICTSHPTSSVSYGSFPSAYKHTAVYSIFKNPFIWPHFSYYFLPPLSMKDLPQNSCLFPCFLFICSYSLLKSLHSGFCFHYSSDSILKVAVELPVQIWCHFLPRHHLTWPIT